VSDKSRKMSARKKPRNDDVTDPDAEAATPRAVALAVLHRIDHKGAFANIALSAALDRTDFATRDKGFVTELVYGTTRMRRACDFAVDRFLLSEVDDLTRTILRLGAYQLVFMQTPPHAAVGETVELAPRKVRGLINAVLRRVADEPPVWPDVSTELSYPDWMVQAVEDDHGVEQARAALLIMNTAPTVTERADGYVQDTASQWVVDAVDGRSGELVLDVCAAPGGKATGLAATGATVVAADRRKSRVGLIVNNVVSTAAQNVHPVVADGLAGPFADATFDKVLVDAPCSGLGVLRRRADARWRVEPEAPFRLADLQRSLLAEAARSVVVGGVLIYSVCTITKLETVDVAATVPAGFEPIPLPDGGPWRPWGRDQAAGGLLLPQDCDTDGMALFRWRRIAGR